MHKKMEKKRKQHYVWEHYLNAWAKDEQVYCLRNNKIFLTNTENVLQRRDFYRLSMVDRQTVNLIKEMFKTKNSVNASLINLIIEDYFSIYSQITSNEMHSNTVDILMNNYIEDIHSDIEAQAIEFIDKLRSKDNRFYKEEISKVRFESFILSQFLRTNKMRKKFINVMSNPELVQKSLNTQWENSINGLKEAWPIFHIISSNILAAAFSLMKYKCVFLEISGNGEFITGDQPVINTKVYEVESVLDLKELEFYYPITNKLAILLTDKDMGNVISVSCEEVDAYNKLIIKASDENLIATKKEILERYIT